MKTTTASTFASLLAAALTVIVGSGCLIAVPRSSPPPGSDVLPPQVSLRGTFGGAPFVGQSALMLRVNDPGTASASWQPEKVPVVTSEIVVFDRPTTCAEAKPRRNDLSGNARSIKLSLRGRWPLAVGSRWPVSHSTGDLRNVEWTASFQTSPRSGLIADGDLEVLGASDRNGTVRVRLRSLNNDGSRAEGVVPFLICP